MKALDLPILFFTLSLIAGILLAQILQFSFSLIILLFTAFVLAGVMIWLKAKEHTLWTSLPFYLIFLLTGLLLAQLHDPLNQKTHFSHFPKKGTGDTITLRISEILKPSLYADRYYADIRLINGDPASGRILLNLSNDSLQHPAHAVSKPDIDEVFYLRETIYPISEPKNPYQFDYGGYLAKKGIYGEISSSPQHLFLIDDRIKTVYGLADHIRGFLQQRLAQYHFNTAQWGVLNALLLGQRQELTEELTASYRDAGVVHILAVSGLHVGMLLLILQFVLRPLGNSRQMRLLRSILVIAGIWAFAFITGGSPSILRAATMFSFLQLGIALNRKNGGMNGLFASALVLLLINPALIFQVGFQLSYLAVFFILWLQPELAAIWRPGNRIARYFWDIITVSIAAQVGVLPLSLFYFHQFPGLFLAANLVVLPLLALILAFGILILTVVSVTRVPDFMALAYAQLIDWLNTFIGWIAQFDALVIRHIYFSATLMLLTYLVFIAGVILIKKLDYKTVLFFLTALVICVFTLVGKKIIGTPEAFYFFYKYRASMVAHQSKSKMTFYTSASLVSDEMNPILDSFKENTPIREFKNKPLKNYYRLKNHKILVVDSLGVYAVPGLRPDYIVLTQSPQINLKRLILKYPKVRVIADASNYKTYVDRWQATCKKLNISFYGIYKDGFFELK